MIHDTSRSVGYHGRLPKPLAIDLFCGLGGWAEGFLAEGWDVIGFDNVRHDYGTGGYPGQLVLQDVLTLDGRQFRNASVIVASPPCTEFSYMAMPWSRGRQIARALRGQDEFPANYSGSQTIEELRRLFDACFRIAGEAGVPLIVENVRGAKPWVGGARWHFGSFYLWGDVPALMPSAALRRLKCQVDCSPQLWRDREGDPRTGVKVPWSDGAGNLSVTTSSKSDSRKAASAQIAKIPFPLAQHIARVFKP